MIGMSFALTNIERLQEWYVSQCNGDWEHAFGITIETLDNPGWWVRIDLNETEWSNLKVTRVVDQRSETDWIEFEVSDSQFKGTGGPKNLNEVLQCFFDAIESA